MRSFDTKKIQQMLSVYPKDCFEFLIHKSDKQK